MKYWRVITLCVISLIIRARTASLLRHSRDESVTTTLNEHDERITRLEEDLVALRLTVHDLRGAVQDTSTISDRRGSLQRRPSIRRASPSESSIRSSSRSRLLTP